MYPNLCKELAANNISNRMAAAEIDMAESTFRYKLTDGEFSIKDAFDIKKNIFPHFTLEYLFKTA